MTIGNALETLKSMENSQGVLGDTNIKFVGPAYPAQEAANLLNTLSGGNQDNIALQNHMDDFVGRLIGGNEATYGNRPAGSNMIKEWLNMFGAAPTVHGCYGNTGTDSSCTSTYGKPITVNVPAINNYGASK